MTPRFWWRTWEEKILLPMQVGYQVGCSWICEWPTETLRLGSGGTVFLDMFVSNLYFLLFEVNLERWANTSIIVKRGKMMRFRRHWVLNENFISQNTKKYAQSNSFSIYRRPYHSSSIQIMYIYTYNHLIACRTPFWLIQQNELHTKYWRSIGGIVKSRTKLEALVACISDKRGL